MIAKKKMIPVSKIVNGLDHSDLKTIRICLKSFDDNILYDANNNIASYFINFVLPLSAYIHIHNKVLNPANNTKY